MADKIFPTDERAQFFLCEDVREEKGGKLTLIGFMPEPKVIVHGYDPKVNKDGHIGGLAFLLTFHDGQGKFATNISVKDPSGVELANSEQILETEKLEDGPMNIIVLSRPFPINPGIHKFSVTLDGAHRYERTFQIATKTE